MKITITKRPIELLDYCVKSMLSQLFMIDLDEVDMASYFRVRKGACDTMHIKLIGALHHFLAQTLSYTHK